MVSCQGELRLSATWKAFNMAKSHDTAPSVYLRGALVLVSGSVTAAVAGPAQRGRSSISIGSVDLMFRPYCSCLQFLVPAAASRSEAIRQGGASLTMKDSGELILPLEKRGALPLVLHLSGCAFSVSRNPAQPIEITRSIAQEDDRRERSSRIEPLFAAEAKLLFMADPSDPPAFLTFGSMVMLQGRLKHAQFGAEVVRVAMLPPGARPRQRLRFLAKLLAKEEVKDQDLPSSDVGMEVKHTVTLTINPDGNIFVCGGKVCMQNKRGEFVIHHGERKAGCLCLDGIRFSLIEGVEISCFDEPSNSQAPPEPSEVRGSLAAFLRPASCKSLAVATKHFGDVVVLEGVVALPSSEQWSRTRPIAQLPKGSWPHRREVFFTSCGSDLQQRLRVDVDMYGRIFCPEGTADGPVELTGILFVAARRAPTQLPKDQDLDELTFEYKTDEGIVAAPLLSRFLGHLNLSQLRQLESLFQQYPHSHLKVPEIKVKGTPANPQNLDPKELEIWNQYCEPLRSRFGIDTFRALFEVSGEYLTEIAENVEMSDKHMTELQKWREKFKRKQRSWCDSENDELYDANFRLQERAQELVDQMWSEWDSRAKHEAEGTPDQPIPSSTRMLASHRYVEKTVAGFSPQDRRKFHEEIRPFFEHYKSVSDHTHTTFYGWKDYFASGTGKWCFPDTPEVQDKLFSYMDWLFKRNIRHFMSERPTVHFPFIEDLDVDVRADYMNLPPGQHRAPPPDHLVMEKPTIVDRAASGDPGPFMAKRAEIIHALYPHLEHLEVLVYSASGWNVGKERPKASFHLVWPQIIVDTVRAQVIRKQTLAAAIEEARKPGSHFQKLAEDLIRVHPSPIGPEEIWEKVFDQTTSVGSGLRLPYNDKATKVARDEDLKRIEDGEISKNQAAKRGYHRLQYRPAKAVGVIRFDFTTSEQGYEEVSAKWIKHERDHSIKEWIQMGSCRRCDPSVQLTPIAGFNDLPFPNIRRCRLSVSEFQQQFTESLQSWKERADAWQSQLADYLAGSFVDATAEQVVWRSAVCKQGTLGQEVEAPRWYDRLLQIPTDRRLTRPTEVVFLKSTGKVIVDGPEQAKQCLLGLLESFTDPDDTLVVLKPELQEGRAPRDSSRPRAPTPRRDSQVVTPPVSPWASGCFKHQ